MTKWQQDKINDIAKHFQFASDDTRDALTWAKAPEYAVAALKAAKANATEAMAALDLLLADLEK